MPTYLKGTSVQGTPSLKNKRLWGLTLYYVFISSSNAPPPHTHLAWKLCIFSGWIGARLIRFCFDLKENYAQEFFWSSYKLAELRLLEHKLFDIITLIPKCLNLQKAVGKHLSNLFYKRQKSFCVNSKLGFLTSQVHITYYVLTSVLFFPNVLQMSIWLGCKYI